MKINAKKRTELGRKTSIIKKEGMIPAVVYGEGMESTSISIDRKEFEGALNNAHESAMIQLVIGKDSHDVFIHDYQKDPVSDEYIHADFYIPSKTKEVSVNVTVTYEGLAPAVKDLGGNLIKEFDELEVKGLATNMPKNIIIDLTKLETFEDRITIADIKLPEGVTHTRGEDEVVAIVVEAKEEKLEEPETTTEEPEEGSEEEPKEEK